jgi:hypothetical protein
MNRRMPSYIIGGIGVVLILMSFTTRLFTVAPAFERLTDDFRPEMKAATLSQLRQDVGGLSAVGAEFSTKAVPQLATALNMTPAQFSGVMGQQFPAVAAGLQRIPQVTQEFNGVLNVLSEERSRFEDADAIPTSSLPATTVPWALAGAGVLCIAVAFIVPRRRGAATAVVLGLAMVVAPLLLSLPAKADAADTMNSHLKPVYTAQLVSGAKQSLAGMQAMGAELQTKMVPALAQMLHMSSAQVQGYLAQNFPTVTAALGSMPATLGRFETMVNTFDRSLDNYDTANGTELVPIVWALLAAGLLAAGTGGYALSRSGAGARATAGQPHVALRERLAHAGHGRFSH